MTETEIDLKELRRLAEAATSGPWEAHTQTEWDDGLDFFGGEDGAFSFPVDLDPEDVALVNAAVNAIRGGLLDRLERAEAERDAAYRALLCAINVAVPAPDVAETIAAARAWDEENGNG